MIFSRGPLVLTTFCLAQFLSPVQAQETPLLTFEVDASEKTLSLHLGSDFPSRAFQAIFVLDPSLYRVTGLSRGADLPPDGSFYSSLFPEGAVDYGDVGEVVPVVSPEWPLDPEGLPVEGGVVLGWFDSFGDEILLEPGERRELAVFHLEEVEAAQQGAMGTLRFADGLRTGMDSPPVRNLITNETGSSVGCDTEDRLLAAGVEVGLPATMLASRPADIRVEEGKSVLAWAATIAIPYRPGGLSLGPVSFENLGLGNAAALVRNAALYRDSDGDGEFSMGDEPVADPAAFDGATQSVTFADAGTVAPGGALEKWFLVLRLAEDAPAQASFGGGGVGPCLALCLLAAVLLGGSLAVRMRWGPGAHALRWIGPAVLCSGLWLSSSCSSGGDSSSARRDLQVQLSELKVEDSATSNDLPVDGLPLVGWSFEA